MLPTNSKHYFEAKMLPHHLICCLHDHLNVEVLRSHSQQLIVIISYVPCITCDALKFLEGGGLLGLAWSGGRRLVACFN